MKSIVKTILILVTIALITSCDKNIDVDISLYEAVEIHETGASIKWSQTLIEEFEEYNLYRHTTQGLDDITGTLVFVTTSVEDTLFIDNNLTPYEEYYYRVYVTYNNGESKGSNIISFFTEDVDISLYEADEIHETGASIKWSQTLIEEFEEYNLYRHTTQGLDDNTGTLVFVTTSVDDTLFIDNNLNPYEEYYYRVYVTYNNGERKGSNIISIFTENANLFPGGDFESESSISDNWYISDGTLTLDSDVKHSGNYSAHKSNIGTSDFFHNLIQIRPNIEYELSFWYKASGNIANMDDFIIDFKQGNDYILGYSGSLGSGWTNPVDQDWTYFSTTIATELNTPLQFYLHANVDNLWIDELCLKVKE